MSKYKAAILMGSDSDYECMKRCFKVLRMFDIQYEAHILSAHRTPKQTEEFVGSAAQNGFGVIIAAAGKAAHLAGAAAANTTLPVIGVPIKSSALGGLDALLSTVQMPAGVPVATVAVDGSENAAFLAARILALSDDSIAKKLCAHKEQTAREIEQKDRRLQEELTKL